MMSLLPEWRLRQFHHEDVSQVLENQGCLDSQGRIRKFNGKTIWPALAELGHDSMDFDKCSCRKD